MAWVWWGEWRVSQFGELTDNRDSKRKPVKEADRHSGPYPYYGASGIVDYVDDYLFDGNYLLVAEDGENLRTRQTPIAFMANGKFWVNNHAHIVTGNEHADTRFLMYALQSTDISGYITGAVMPKLTQGNLNQIEIAHPSIDEQRAIARILGALDDKIELNRRMNQTLEDMARALFKSWFVDFDGVAQEDMQESELGLIPKGWRVGSVYEVADVIYGAPFASKLFDADKSGKPLIRIRDLADENPGVWTSEVHPKGYLVKAGDIVVGMDGEFRAHLWGGSDAWLNQRICVLKPKANVSAAFVRNSIIAPLAYIESSETATAVIHLGKGDIDNFEIVIPPSEVLTKFGQACQPFYDRTVTNKRESRTLAQLCDTLLPKLISGELRVRDAEHIAEKTI